MIWCKCCHVLQVCCNHCPKSSFMHVHAFRYRKEKNKESIETKHHFWTFSCRHYCWVRYSSGGRGLINVNLCVTSNVLWNKEMVQDIDFLHSAHWDNDHIEVDMFFKCVQLKTRWKWVLSGSSVFLVIHFVPCKLYVLIISRGAEGPGREILQRPPICLSVHLSVCPSRLVFAL